VGDRELAALAAAGDEEAFEAIFERHHSGLLSLCRHLLGSPEEAEDAVQHTFAAAYRQLVEREPPEHLRAWLYTTANAARGAGHALAGIHGGSVRCGGAPQRPA
jgi:DNA-directed RNA polymerase specialized sigma24 family protein